MITTIRKSQSATLKSLDNLFIEMTAKSCNQRCKYCYIDFPQFKKTEDFIKTDIVEKTLQDLKNTDIKCIYMTGAEPMTHPDFNTILRLCLKKTNVCICTNGSFINEKKARFLKKVEDESNHEIIIKISFTHYDEVKNDDIRYRGAFRHGSFAIKHLAKYGFAPVINITNYYNEDLNRITKKFTELFENYGIDKNHIFITSYYDKTSETEVNNQTKWNRLDCEYGRILTGNGIYSCPFLANDYRGRCGKNINDSSDNIPLETNFCEICKKSPFQMFGLDFSVFDKINY